MPLIRNTSMLISTLFIILSCGTSEKATKEGIVDIDNFRAYPIDVDVKERSVFQFVESVKVLGLEETNESLLENLTDAIFLDNHIVFKNGRQEEIMVYSEGGKFLTKIKQQGNGPEEYVSIRNLWVNDNLIQVYDGRHVISFDLAGDFVSVLSLKNRVSHLHGNTNGFVADVGRAPLDGDLRYNLEFLNEELERDTLAIPYTKLKKTSIFWLSTPFSLYNKDVAYQHTNGDTLYKILSDGAAPLLSVDFGEKWIWKDEAVYDNIQKQRMLRSENGAISMFFMRASQNFIYADAIRSGKFLINRATGDYQKITFNKNGEGQFYPRYINWVNNELAFSLSSADIGEFLSQLDPAKVQYLADHTLETIETSENPVVIWIKFTSDLK
ncbi:6-bladed beta-propeller [Roseivirga sp.]|uniref:6-bladed beta-propeller n=1 Tax=Roseivirga sp. TaxID=1964215 RepID=UPI003B8D9349